MNYYFKICVHHTRYEYVLKSFVDVGNGFAEPPESVAVTVCSLNFKLYKSSVSVE